MFNILLALSCHHKINTTGITFLDFYNSRYASDNLKGFLKALCKNKKQRKLSTNTYHIMTLLNISTLKDSKKSSFAILQFFYNLL